MARERFEEFAVGSTAHTSIATPPTGLTSALDTECIGLWPANSFSLRTGKPTDCEMSEEGLQYFQKQLIAVPGDAATISGFTARADRNSDIASWAKTPESTSLAHPPFVWIGSPSILSNASILPGVRRIRTSDGAELDIKLVPKLPANRSYADSATAAYFAGREVRMRGAIEKENGKPLFVARTIWPRDFSLDLTIPTGQPETGALDLAAFIRQPPGEKPGPETCLLWERFPNRARAWTQKPVLSLILNGAQGDDNESLGGHFVVATGRIGVKGDWSNWAVNNFYSQDSASRKGIIPATVPMDNYLMDLNSGQQYYRPSYMLVAVLSDQRTAVAYQGGAQRVFRHAYRNGFRYCHARTNCAGIGIDIFESLGWHIPRRGPTAPSTLSGIDAHLSARTGSLPNGRTLNDYLNEEQIRLLPALAFEAAALDLLQVVGATPSAQRHLSGYEEQLRSDVDAILLVRIPQIPSSRALGSAPVFSMNEFFSRTAQDRAA